MSIPFLNRLRSLSQARLFLWYPLLFLFCCCTAQVHGQNAVYSFGEANVDDYGTTVVPGPAGHYLIGGSRNNQASIMMVSATGSFRWGSHFLDSTATRHKICSLAMTPDSFIVGVGNAEPDGTHGHRYDGFVFKMDLIGNLIWARREAHPTGVYFDRIIVVDSSEYIISYVYEYDISATADDIALARVRASDGSITAITPRIDINPSNYLDDVGGLVLAPNGDIYVSGRIYVAGTTTESMRPFIMRFDANLNLIWTKYYMFPPIASARMYGLELRMSGNDLVLATVGNRFSNSANYTMGLMKLDLDGNQLWAYDYDIPASGTDIGWGFTTNASGYNLVGESETDWLFSIQTDMDGVPLWTKKIGSGANSLALDAWGGAVAAGPNEVAFVATRNFGDLQTIFGVMDLQGDLNCEPNEFITPIVTVVPPYVQPTSVIYYTDSLPMKTGPMGLHHTTLEPCAGAPAPYLGADTTGCVGTFVLDGTMPDAISYLWQDGSTDPIFVATSPGTYWVVVTTACCTTTDTMTISPGLTVNLGNDFVLCYGDSSVLDAQIAGAHYLWSTGDTTQSIMGYAPGTYSVTVSGDSGCSGSDVVTISASGPPGVNLGPDLELCGEDGVVLKNPLSWYPMVWSTGETTFSIYVDSSDTYSVTVTTECGDISGSISVNFIKEDRLFIPNVFSPDGDGINEMFMVEGPVYEGYELQVFDRWGRRLFTSYDIEQRWDGRLGGRECPAGVYYYSLRVLNCDRDLTFKAGNVTLVR